MKNNLFSLGFVFLILSLSLEAKDSMTIKIINQSKDTITAYVNKSENVGSSNADNIVYKIILPKQEYSTTIDVDRYNVLTGYATFNKGGKSPDRYKVVTKKNDIFSFIIDIPQEGNKSLISLQSSEKILEYDQVKFLDTDVTPKPLEGLFSQYLGGLVAYIDSASRVIPKHTISPTDLGTKMKPGFGSTTSSKEINFVNQNTQNIRGNIPTIAQLGITWDNSSLYNVKMEYSKIGVIDYVSNGVSLAQAFNKLSKDELFNLGYLKVTYPTLKIRQINQAYCFEAVYIEVNQGTSLGMSNDVNASTFFTNKGNFKISTSALDKKVFGNSYLGYWFTRTAPDLTGSLNYAVAIYYSVTNNVSLVKKDEDVLAEYNALREKNNTLPALTSKQQINEYFKTQVDNFKTFNPEFKTDKSLQAITIKSDDPINKLPENVLRKNYELLSKENEGIPDHFDPNAAKIYLEAFQLNRSNIPID